MNTIQDIIQRINDGQLDERLLEIYQTKDRLSRERKRLISSIAEFSSLFPEDQEIEIYSAPGRSEIGGNHTDHQQGEVLAASITDDAIAIASRADAPRIRLLSKGYPMLTISIEDLQKDAYPDGTTEALIAGVAAGMKDRGYSIGGFDAFVTSDVLSGSGLSSSAAFETLIGCILSGLYNDMKLTDVENAMIGQYAENVFFGKPCGLMDQMACSVGSLCHIDFRNPSDPVIERIEFDLETAGYSLCITDTKGSHADLTDDYAAVPAEMKAVASLFGKNVLIEVTEEEVLQQATRIRETCGDRAFLRAMHFYAENKRVQQEAAALKAKDMDGFLRLVRASGDSSYKYLQNVYTSHDLRHQNVAVALMLSEHLLGDNGVCRVHGGGFAGTIQAFVKKDAIEAYRTQMDAFFGEGSCSVLGIRKFGGIRIV
ncbi:MAG: galactokinase [Lachnospiraceae bacterium]|nr:galactokinase [Lachnospiraceae bacterium]